MRIRNNPNAKEEIENFDRYLGSKEDLENVLKKSDKKICLEIGMGKGDFITNMALNNKDSIFIGVELCMPVLALAIKKLGRFEEEKGVKIDNLYLMSFDASNIDEMFSNFKIDKLYLNFSDPWPKKKHAKRRLTYKTFLEKYDKIMKDDTIVEFKTDNRKLFEFSLTSIANYGFEFLDVYLDLHSEDIPNVVTEYEEKFSKFGPIYKLVFKRKV